MTESPKVARSPRLNDELQRRLAGEASKGLSAAPREAPDRPSVREDDPRARAAARAAELREHLGDVNDATDEFYVDLEVIPDGWTYEWKRHTVYGQEDPAYQVQLARSGWTPVPRTRHPEMMPISSPDAIITRKGMVLMECPTEICEERRRQDQRAARDQVRFKEAQLAGAPDGQFSREDPRVAPKVKKSFSPVDIPE